MNIKFRKYSRFDARVHEPPSRRILEAVPRGVRDLVPEDLPVCSGWKWFCDGRAWAALNRCYSSSRCTRDSRILFSVDEDLPRERCRRFAASPFLPRAFARKGRGEASCCTCTDENHFKVFISSSVSSRFQRLYCRGTRSTKLNWGIINEIGFTYIW